MGSERLAVHEALYDLIAGSRQVTSASRTARIVIGTSDMPVKVAVSGIIAVRDVSAYDFVSF